MAPPTRYNWEKIWVRVMGLSGHDDADDIEGQPINGERSLKM